MILVDEVILCSAASCRSLRPCLSATVENTTVVVQVKSELDKFPDHDITTLLNNSCDLKMISCGKNFKHVFLVGMKISSVDRVITVFETSGEMLLLHLPTQMRFLIGGESVRCRGLNLSNSLRWIKLTNSLGKQQLELWTRTWSRCAPWNRGKFVHRLAWCKKPLKY